ncbi:aspartate--tRNA ligase [Candidatus Falkowbacteria bacterium RBG_13_39_14]|uniref:Aspartate--tRNA(Asp/Asn) ligase n=1 Tax=Candidatus Falkowbacteria bacterium RBG_13_39_14 TaxID=1797985 RepID=A0A1F5S2M4_9BACT|nr:MAG: aspartate--tRNA ligase [Candidatus Falkowbacteria bacterium RBG_13_39_14]
MYRTNTCGELNKSNAGDEVILSGWVNSRRDHGGLIFIDLRDRYGMTQISFDPEVNKDAWHTAEEIRSEYVIKVKGDVVLRPEEMINKKLYTGEIEIKASGVEILNTSETPPFEISAAKDIAEANEAIRLKYRFIDLRRPVLQEMLKIKDNFITYIREYFHKEGFVEVQTPILANSSPEGARDFLVPSRYYPGKFYALPQAPQQFKQLLMVGGLDKYFQIAPCFRDEDPRVDRHYGEFYQLDMEMSFVEQEDVLKITERLMKELTEKFSEKKLTALDEKGKFKRIPWKEAMNKYGSDKPDLRFGLEIKDISDLTKGCGFSVFADAVKNGGVVHALKVDGGLPAQAGAKFTRKEIDELTEVAKAKGAKGLAYIAAEAEDGKIPLSARTADKNPPLKKGEITMKSPIIKFLGDDLAMDIVKFVGGKPGDIIFFGADNWRTVCQSLGAVRNECGTRLGLKDNVKAAWCWIVDFPMYDYSEIEEGRIDFGHNPFSMPQGGIGALETQKPLEILAHQFDLVLNGFEASSGAIRNHRPDIMYKAFEIAGYKKEEVDAKFGAMIEAFRFGAPPHGGNAPGIDRILMVLNDWDSIRDMYAFPKDGAGRDVMMGSPCEVEPKQLKELGIKIA